MILSGRRFKSKDPAKAREARTVDGRVFGSKLEAAHYVNLKTLLHNGKITKLQTQPKFVFIVNDVWIGEWKADFAFIETVDNSVHVQDVKAWKENKRTFTMEPILDKTDPWKKNLMRACFGIEVEYV